MIITLRNAFASAAMLLASGLVSAQAGSASYQRTGSLDSISTGSAVINDTGYQISPRVLVYSAAGRLLTASNLVAGQQIGFNAQRFGGDGATVTEIWLLQGVPRNEE